MPKYSNELLYLDIEILVIGCQLYTTNQSHCLYSHWPTIMNTQSSLSHCLLFLSSPISPPICQIETDILIYWYHILLYSLLSLLSLFYIVLYSEFIRVNPLFWGYWIIGLLILLCFHNLCLLFHFHFLSKIVFLFLGSFVSIC